MSGKRETARRVSNPDWNCIGPSGHAVQFYEHDGTLADQLAGFIGTALVTGDAAIVISTTKHRDDLHACLAARGLEVEIARREGRYLAAAADETLREVCSSDGWPDAARFRTVVGALMDRVLDAVASDRPRLAAFGEMVALLCSSGRYAAAVRLEELWNELASSYTFSLVCAYPMSLFKADASAPARFMKICAQHSHVFSADRRNSPMRPRSFDVRV
jgi:hypothetical protein